MSGIGFEIVQCPELAPAITVLAHTDNIDYVRINEDVGPWIVSAGHDCYLKWWDLNTCRPLKSVRAHLEALYCVDVSPAKTHLASCSADKGIGLWDSRTFAAAGRVENAHDNKIYFVKYANDTTLISSGRDGAIKIWDLRNTRAPKLVVADGKTYKSIDCKYPLVAAGSTDSHVKIFNLETGALVQKTDIDVDMSVFSHDAFFVDPPTVVQSVRFCNVNNDQLLTAHDDLAVRNLHLSQFGLNILNIARQHLCSVRHIEIASDDSAFVSTCLDGSVRLWDFEFMRTTMFLVGNAQIVVRDM